MKIKIAGINGYLGQLLADVLQKNGHSVSGIKRALLYGSEKELSNEIKGNNVVINLAGAPILTRWTPKNKVNIYNSRIKTSANIVKAINKLEPKDRPTKYISASAIGIYNSGLKHNEDSTNFDAGFVGKVVNDWEDTLLELPRNIHTIIFRIGLVLGKEAKTIGKLKLPFKLGLGGKIGSGNQAFPFIHEKDVQEAFVWAVEELQEGKTINLVAPQNITNSEFTKTFAQVLHRPALFPVPGFLLKLVLGESASLLLKSPVVVPKALLEAGFEFKYPTIKEALEEILI